MYDTIIFALEHLNIFFWGICGFTLIMLLGLYFTVATRLFQFRAFPAMLVTFWESLSKRYSGAAGVNPIKLLFASVGGMVGIGNLVGVVAAIQIGGPGALFWTWIAASVGSLIKYGEVYLGIKYRIPNNRGGYDGGPMFFLQKAFGNMWVPNLICVLLCLYGVEIYQFNIVVDSLSENWSIDRNIVVPLFLLLVLYSGAGGIARVGKISAFLLPAFILAYLTMSIWVISYHWAELPAILMDVFKSAFTGHAAVGGFAGSTIMMAIQQGLSRAAYSADIGIGNDSVIHSESQTVFPALQARLGMFGVFLDNFICTIGILVVLTSGVWKAEEPIPASSYLLVALSEHFPMMGVFMPLLILILGYTTLIAFFSVGTKCARFLFPKFGVPLYFLYAAIVLPLFAYVDQKDAFLIMSLAGGMLMIINLLGVYRLRKEIEFCSN